MITYLPYWLFVVVHTALGSASAYLLYKEKERTWSIVILAYTVIVLLLSTIFLYQIYGVSNLSLLFVSPADVWTYIQIISIATAAVLFFMGVPLYIVAFVVIGFGFVWTAITRQPTMWKVMKMISVILIAIGLITLVLGLIQPLVNTLFGVIPVITLYYSFSIAGSFISGYTFIVSFLGGIVESYGSG